VAVEAFLAGRIRWVDIAAVVAEVLAQHDGGTATALEDVLEADRRARALARASFDR
jgi:1-deoxy-D-xylulose-5-phosphate reductoisomerase